MIMAKKETAAKETTIEKPLKYTIEFPDGTIVNGELLARPFQPNKEKRFQNTGYQTRIVSGLFSGSLMIIDAAKQKAI